MVRENIHTHQMEGQWKFQRGGGSQKPKNLKESMGLNWNFHRGVGIQTKQLSVGGCEYFLERHNCAFNRLCTHGQMAIPKM